VLSLSLVLLGSFSVRAFNVKGNSFGRKLKPVYQSTKSATRSASDAEASSVEVKVPKVPTAAEVAKKKRMLDGPDLWEYNFGLQDPRLALPHASKELVPEIN
jgi:hypothetical protein